MVFVMDESGSIGVHNFGRMKNLALNIVDAFEIGPNDTRVGWINFNQAARIVFNLDTYQTKNSLKDGISAIEYRNGGTNISVGLLALLDSLSAYGRNAFDIPEIAIVVTDGQSEITHIQNAAALIHMDRNVDVFAVGVGTGIQFNQLYAVASAGIAIDTSQNVFRLKDFSIDELDHLQETLKRRACFSELYPFFDLFWPIYTCI